MNGSSLNLTLFHQGFFEEYTAPVVDVMIERGSKSNVFGYAPLPAPLLAWVFTPEKMQNFTQGCTERRFSNSEPDESKKVKTGKSEWKDIKNSHMIQVSGFDKDYQFWVQNNNEIPKQEVIDLSSAILNTQLSKNTTLKITCLDCNLAGVEEKSLYPNIKMDVVLTHDVRATKLALIETQKIRAVEAEKAKSEQTMRDKEIAKQVSTPKVNAASSCTNDFDCPTGYSCRTKPVSGAECKWKSPVYDPPNTATTQPPEITQNPATTYDEPIISNLEEIKTQCAKLFKPKTEKFGKCVLELTK
ncbi:hypothetical protein LBMAG43_19630 [Methylococcaceae bacterium]|nr:hypothetical protein LBMAG43_19630 [Methylococcaceae bacterium]